MIAFNKKKQKLMRKEFRKEKQNDPKILSGIEEEFKVQSLSNPKIKIESGSDSKQAKLQNYPVMSLNYDNESLIKKSAKDGV